MPLDTTPPPATPLQLSPTNVALEDKSYTARQRLSQEKAQGDDTRARERVPNLSKHSGIVPEK